MKLGTKQDSTANKSVVTVKRGASIKVPGSPLIERTHTPEGRQRAIDALQSFDEGDHSEQSASWAILKEALDRDRLSHRKLFP